MHVVNTTYRHLNPDRVDLFVALRHHPRCMDLMANLKEHELVAPLEIGLQTYSCACVQTYCMHAQCSTLCAFLPQTPPLNSRNMNDW